MVKPKVNAIWCQDENWQTSEVHTAWLHATHSHTQEDGDAQHQFQMWEKMLGTQTHKMTHHLALSKAGFTDDIKDFKPPHF